MNKMQPGLVPKIKQLMQNQDQLENFFNFMKAMLEPNLPVWVGDVSSGSDTEGQDKGIAERCG